MRELIARIKRFFMIVNRSLRPHFSRNRYIEDMSSSREGREDLVSTMLQSGSAWYDEHDGKELVRVNSKTFAFKDTKLLALTVLPEWVEWRRP